MHKSQLVSVLKYEIYFFTFKLLNNMMNKLKHSKNTIEFINKHHMK